MDVNKLLVRCSGIGNIMARPKSAADKLAGKLGKTAMSAAHDLYINAMYSRKKEYSNKYIKKGLTVEEDALTLLTVTQKIYFQKNSQRLKNDFITGEPDTYIGKRIEEAEEGFDVKACWDIWTFPAPTDEIDPIYEWQDHGYMALTGAKAWTTAYCLVNATPELIMAEKRKVFYTMDCPEPSEDRYRQKVYEDYIAKCGEIEKNMIFDMGLFKKHNPHFDLDITDWKYDIPKEDRIRLYKIYRDDETIRRIYGQVEKVRHHIAGTYLHTIPAALVVEEKKSIIKRRA